MAASPPADDRLRSALRSRPTLAGITVGLVFWWESLSPTLMPRTWVTQAAMTALLVAIGIGIGTLLGTIGQGLLQATGRDVGAGAKRTAWRVVSVLGLIVVGLGVVVWPRWQTDQREGVSLDALPAVQGLLVVLLALVLLVVLVTIGRLVGRGVRRIYRVLDRRLPALVATPLTVLVVLLLASFLLRNLAADAFFNSVNATFGVVDKSTNEGTVQPTDAERSGSPPSFAPWDTLGMQGRDFVAQAPTPAQLRRFAGDDAPVKKPIRVYVGLRSASSTEKRAALAVRELERTDAFHRKILVVVTTTGSGWVDPDAAIAVEQMYGGDTALVAQQYSYLPSWIATLDDHEAPSSAGAALFHAVRERWLKEPEATRPRLVVFGLSLGSYGAEAAFAGPDAATSVENLVNRTEGALFTGPTNDNPIWRQLTASRDAGSPVWRPTFEATGGPVTFVNRDGTAGIGSVPPPGPGDPARILYIQHPTDPVTFWNFDSLWSSPEWMDHPRGIGVPDRGSWFPIVTGVQGVFDLMAGFGAPPGYGHDYRLDYVAGWAQVAPPEGWTPAKTRQLEDLLHSR